MMQEEFGRRIDALVHERFRSAARFAEAVRADGCEISETHLSRILRGVHPPPVDQLAAWARILQLKGRDADAFRLAGELAQLPDGSLVEKKIRQQDKLVARLAEEVEKLQREVALLRQRFTTRVDQDPTGPT